MALSEGYPKELQSRAGPLSIVEFSPVPSVRQMLRRASFEEEAALGFHPVRRHVEPVSPEEATDSEIGSARLLNQFPQRSGSRTLAVADGSFRDLHPVSKIGKSVCVKTRRLSPRTQYTTTLSLMLRMIEA